MSTRPVRLIHAGDFHLGRPLYGLVDVPETLRDRLIDAPYDAARRVFDTALAKRCDALLLSGDLLDPCWSPPRAERFLVEQFTRLAEHGMAVFWSGSGIDAPSRWKGRRPFPDNVHWFPSRRAERQVRHRDGEPRFQVVGQSHPCKSGSWSKIEGNPPCDVPTVVLAYDPKASLPGRGGSFDFVALGGRHSRETLDRPGATVHFAGSPQGRSPHESGPHGCTVVEIESDAPPRLEFHATDALRWHKERIDVDVADDPESLAARLHERIEHHAADATRPELLLAWTVTGRGPLLRRLRHEDLASRLLDELGARHDSTRPRLWSIQLEAEAAGLVPQALYEQETLLGDFLRMSRQYAADTPATIDITPYLPAAALDTATTARLSLDDRAVRDRVLAGAVQLGVELVGGPHVHGISPQEQAQ